MEAGGCHPTGSAGGGHLARRHVALCVEEVECQVPCLGVEVEGQVGKNERFS